MAVATTERSYQPVLPLAPGGAVMLAPGVDLLESERDGGVVFLAGHAAWSWAAGDACGRRLAAVGIVEAGAASQRQVAAGFRADETTLWRWRQAYAAAGAAGLATAAMGPKRASKLTGEVVAEIVRLRGEGLSMAVIAERVGVSTNSVSRALKATSAPSAAAGAASGSGGAEAGADEGGQRIDAAAAAVEEVAARAGELEALARPVPRMAERQAARAGLCDEAPPVITEGAGLPSAGALVILPALAATGLVEVAEEVYGRARKAFYGLRSLLLTIVFAAVAGEPRAEGLSRLDPADLGRLLGLDRAPEPKTLRRRIGELAAAGKADRLLAGLARRHVAANAEACGIFYADGHVRAYHGRAEVPKTHLARMRLSMPAETDLWVADARGDGVLVWQTPPGASLASGLPAVCAAIRRLVGADARPTVCFDRGGWSPKLFARLDADGFDILTYRKAPLTPEPDEAFTEHTFTDPAGRVHRYLLADRAVTLAYDGGRGELACRQITRRRKDGGQTQLITTDTDTDAATLAHAMTARWRQENFFAYMRHHYALDALDAYTTTPDDPGRSVPNPAKTTATEAVRAADAAIASAQATLDRHTLRGIPEHLAETHAALADAIDDAKAYRDRLRADAAATPARSTIAALRPASRRLDPEHKRIADAARLAAYNAESALARLLAPHYARADDEARSLLREIFHAPADLEIIDRQLHVRIHPLSAPRRTRALAALCDELTATRTVYPGTDLTLVYTTKAH